MSVIGQKAQDISRLPAMNKHGYVAQISNTADLETDDYYVKFEANNGTSELVVMKKLYDLITLMALVMTIWC